MNLCLNLTRKLGSFPSRLHKFKQFTLLGNPIKLAQKGADKKAKAKAKHLFDTKISSRLSPVNKSDVCFGGLKENGVTQWSVSIQSLATTYCGKKNGGKSLILQGRHSSKVGRLSVLFLLVYDAIESVSRRNRHLLNSLKTISCSALQSSSSQISCSNFAAKKRNKKVKLTKSRVETCAQKFTRTNLGTCRVFWFCLAELLFESFPYSVSFLLRGA